MNNNINHKSIWQVKLKHPCISLCTYTHICIIINIYFHIYIYMKLSPISIYPIRGLGEIITWWNQTSKNLWTNICIITFHLVKTDGSQWRMLIPLGRVWLCMMQSSLRHLFLSLKNSSDFCLKVLVGQCNVLIGFLPFFLALRKLLRYVL